MKIAVIIPTKIERQKHIDTLLAGGVRIGKTNTTVHLLGESENKNSFPKNFIWENYGKITPFLRTVEFLFSKKALKYDLIFLCDDDSLTCANGMHTYFSNTWRNDPCTWGGHPGHEHTDDRPPYGPILKDCIATYMGKDFKYQKQTYHGWESGAINKSAVRVLQKNPKVRDVLIRFASLSREPNGSPLWAAELVIRSIATILSFPALAAPPNEGLFSMMPWFLECRVLTRTSLNNIWHCHFTHNHKSLDHNDLINAIKNGPFKNPDYCVNTLFPRFKYGIKARNFINKELKLGVFWMPWLNLGREMPSPFVLEEHEKSPLILFKDRKTSRGGTWAPIKKGFAIYINNDLKEIYRWQKNNIILGTQYRNNKVVSFMPCLFI